MKQQFIFGFNIKSLICNVLMGQNYKFTRKMRKDHNEFIPVSQLILLLAIMFYI